MRMNMRIPFFVRISMHITIKFLNVIQLNEYSGLKKEELSNFKLSSSSFRLSGNQLR